MTTDSSTASPQVPSDPVTTPPPGSVPVAEGLAPPMQTVGLSAFFGSHEAVEDISLTFPERTVTAIIGPSGCGKSTFIRTLNRMHELPNAYATGEVLLRGQNVYGRGADPVAIRRAIGMVFQRPNPFPTKSIGRQHLRRPAVHPDGAAPERAGRAPRARPPRSGPLGRGQEPPRRARGGPVGGPAAAPVHRPGARRGAGGPPHGRAVLGARSPVHAAHRGAHLRAQVAPRDRDRHAQHAAGRARLRLHGILHHRERGRGGPPRRAGRTDQIFSRPANPRTEAYVSGRFG